MVIYVNYNCHSKETAEKKISEISYSAAQSIDMGYPGEHGGFMLKAINGYVAQTSGGVVYGFIDRAVWGGVQNCAILGFERSGSLTGELKNHAEWEKVEYLDWIKGVSKGLYGWIDFDGYLKGRDG